MDTAALIASLTAVQPDTDSVYLSGDRYLDWTSVVEDAGQPGIARVFELGSGAEAAALTMDRDEMKRLHAALTLTLLRDAQA